MTSTQVISGLIADAVAPILRRAVFPETTFATSGADVPERLRKKDHQLRSIDYRYATKQPLAPRDRLAARLAVLCALTECKNQLMKDILRDVEAIADAKAHNSMEGP